MEVSLVSIATVFAAVAVAQKPVTSSEQRGWYECTATLLDKFEKGDDGSKAACDLWSCLQLQATRWQRGGGITALSSVLDPVCWGTNVGSNFMPGFMKKASQCPQVSPSHKEEASAVANVRR
ncbi:hypothetical protein LQW54_005116 [Pestalotiopsis sp. IQ-011]